MRFVAFVPGLALALLCGTELDAQGGGRGRGRPDEITNRTGAFFTDVAGPATDGDKIADLASIELIRLACGAGQLSLLYLYDSGDDADVRDQFERTLFAADELGIELRCFHTGRIDLAKEAALKAKFGKQAPLFVAFDLEGKPTELSMAGYKPSASALGKLLEKQANGVIKPALATFAKAYGDLVRDLEQLLVKKKMASEKLAKAGPDKGKRAEAEKDLKTVEAEEQKVLEREKELLAKMKLPERSDKAQRLGGRGFGGPGRGGPGGGGQGGGGKSGG